mmetsp:Transcript_15198/g.27596  ORF Transcript_15198/g.27596 Transcript_15198/m.27596 type:complete len:323 (-) Transcript_15198:1828-2796(-)
MENFHQHGHILGEFVLELTGHVPHDAALGVVKHGILKGQIDIAFHLLQRPVNSIIQLFLDRAQIHRFLNNLEIIRQSQLHGIYGTVKHPSVGMTLNYLQHIPKLGLQLGHRQHQPLIKGLNVRLNLLQRKTVDEGMILLGPGAGGGHARVVPEHLAVGEGLAGGACVATGLGGGGDGLVGGVGVDVSLFDVGVDDLVGGGFGGRGGGDQLPGGDGLTTARGLGDGLFLLGQRLGGLLLLCLLLIGLLYMRRLLLLCLLSELRLLLLLRMGRKCLTRLLLLLEHLACDILPICLLPLGRGSSTRRTPLCHTCTRTPRSRRLPR